MNKSLAIFGGSYLLSLKQPTLAQAGTAPSGPAGGAPGFEAAKGASLFAAAVSLDTKSLADGEHGLRIEAQDATGQVGVRHLRFQVRNGPGITVSGLGDGAVLHGTVRFMVNAFGAEEPFEPHRAESPSPIPVWVWVLSLLIVA